MSETAIMTPPPEGPHTAARAPLPAVLALLAPLLAGCESSPDGSAAADGAPAPGAAEAAPPEVTSGLGSYLAARHARRHHDTAAAQVYFDRALSDRPASAELLDAALTSTLAERDMAAAEALARRLVVAAPDNALARVALATVHTVAGDPAAAVIEIDAMPPAGINLYVAPLLRAWSLVEQGDMDGALAALRPLAARSVFAGARDYHAGLIADLAGRPAAAEPAFAGALSAPRGGSLRAVLTVGNFFRRHGRDDEARAVYDAFLDENPGTTFLDRAYRRLDSGAAPAPPPVANARDGYAEALFTVAASLSGENAPEIARIHAQLCLAVRPGHDSCRMLLGDLYAQVERHAEAEAAYNAVAADSPLKWALRLRAANMLAELGRIDTAAERLRAMAQERPERPDPLIALADMMLREERYTEASDAYGRALARIPALESRHWVLLHARGMALERSQQWESAERDFLRALELQPDQPLVLNYLGYSWVEMGRNYDRARAMIEKAVEQRPNDGYIVDSLGWVLYRLGEYDEAADHLERAATLRPGDPVILDHFGDSLWRVGRRTEARFQWRRALTFEPETELEAALRDKIENGLAPDPPPFDAEDL